MQCRSDEELKLLGSQFLTLIQSSTPAELDAFLKNLTPPTDLVRLLRDYENSAFQQAASHHHLAIPILLKHGADPTVENTCGANALTYLLNTDFNPEVAISLIAKGVHPNTQDRQGYTLWHRCVLVTPYQVPRLLSEMRRALDECKSKTPIACKTEIHEISYDRDKKIASGSFSTVYRGYLKENIVAIKRIPFEIQSRAKSEYEKYILQRLTEMGAENIVGYYGHAVGGTAYYIIMEYCADSSLWYRIKSTEKPSDNLCIKFMIDITNGLTYLHKIKFTHRDLRSANVLIDEDRAKLCDFGKSDVINNDCYLGYPFYAAPELFTDKQNTEKTDIWSLASTFWEIAAWTQFFKDLTKEKADKKLVAFPPNIAGLITWGWKQNPTERPTANELLAKLNTLLI
jgi:tRNA A-37 threonylcarbamoyl transferase component Bud32